MLALRADEAPKHRGEALAVRDLFLKTFALPRETCVALTIAHKHEIDPMPLGLALLSEGHTLCLPAVSGKGLPLDFRLWRPGDPLVPGPSSIPQPPEKATPATPSLLLVPLLAFDRRANRLGQGGGYYDRTLVRLRKEKSVLAVGLGYAFQEISSVPTGPYDIRLDTVVSEREVIWPAQDNVPHRP